MATRRVCSFCGNEVEPGTGTMFVRRDGTVFFFDRSKCEKNLLSLKRVPRTVRWTRAALQAKARATGMAFDEARPEVAVVADRGGAEVVEDFEIQIPKGKDIPQAVTALIDRRLGPNLSGGDIEHRFREFTASDALRESVSTWYAKRHRRRLTKLPMDDYIAFLDTSAGKKVLKDWLEDEAKKETAAKEA